MIARNLNQSWGHNPIPPTLVPIPKRPKGYGVESVSRLLIMGAPKARQARWTPRRRRVISATCLPAENVAAIKLLDSWLSTPIVEYDEFQERLDRLVEENRL